MKVGVEQGIRITMPGRSQTKICDGLIIHPLTQTVTEDLLGIVET